MYTRACNHMECMGIRMNVRCAFSISILRRVQHVHVQTEHLASAKCCLRSNHSIFESQGWLAAEHGSFRPKMVFLVYSSAPVHSNHRPTLYGGREVDIVQNWVRSGTDSHAPQYRAMCHIWENATNGVCECVWLSLWQALRGSSRTSREAKKN